MAEILPASATNADPLVGEIIVGGRRRAVSVVLVIDGAGAVVDPTRPRGVAVEHLNGVSVAGATQVLPADPARIALTVRNASDTQMRMRVDGSEAGASDYPLDAGRGYEFPTNMVPVGAVSLHCASAGKAWAIMAASLPDA